MFLTHSARASVDTILAQSRTSTRRLMPQPEHVSSRGSRCAPTTPTWPHWHVTLISISREIGRRRPHVKRKKKPPIGGLKSCDVRRVKGKKPPPRDQNSTPASVQPPSSRAMDEKSPGFAPGQRLNSEGTREVR
jgi:hypothetical protein